MNHLKNKSHLILKSAVIDHKLYYPRGQFSLIHIQCYTWKAFLNSYHIKFTWNNHKSYAESQIYL